VVDLRLDLDAIEESEQTLRSLHREFGSVEHFDEGLSEAAGHRRLGDALDDFGGAWNDRREALTEQINAVAEAAQAIHETFRELDAQLAQHADELVAEG
jgi:transposase